jgi:hypothetical protein
MHTATIPEDLRSDTGEDIPLELILGFFAVDWEESGVAIPKVKAKDAEIALIALSRDLTALKKHGSPTIHQIHTLAQRTWACNVAYRRQLRKLKNLQERLTRHSEIVWRKFDTILIPLWNFDEQLIPIYEQLSEILLGLEELQSKPFSVSFGENLAKYQEKLREIEERHVRDGKIFADSGSVPRGQAMCITLLNRCYSVAYELNCEESNIDSSLVEVYHRLLDLVDNISCLRDTLDLGYEVDPLELQLFNEQVDSIASLKINDKFLNPEGQIAEGQFTLQKELDMCYNLLHECVIIQASRESGGSFADQISKLSNIRDSAVSMLKNGTFMFVNNIDSMIVQPIVETVNVIKDVTDGSVKRIRSIVKSCKLGQYLSRVCIPACPKS